MDDISSFDGSSMVDTVSGSEETADVVDSVEETGMGFGDFYSFEYFMSELSFFKFCDFPVPDGMILPFAGSVVVWYGFGGVVRAVKCLDDGTTFVEVKEWHVNNVVVKVRVVIEFPFYSVVKATCEKCRCLVTVVGHLQRCAIPAIAVSGSPTSVMRRRAWIGDALHNLDVRLAVSRMCDEDKQLITIEQEYTTRDAQARYMRIYMAEDGELTHAPRGMSVNLLSEAFEANYEGMFRDKYLDREFPGQRQLGVADYSSMLRHSV